MWPWGHLAVGYLLYSVGVRLRYRRPPAGPAAVALAFGTQFPDLVDKPLAWSFGVIPNGRSLTHSLLTAVVLVVLLELLLRRYDAGSIATAFGVGYFSHLFTDALYPALAGEYARLGFLGWPVVPPVEYGPEPSFTSHFRELTLDSFVALELGLGVFVFLVWLADGAPGFGIITAIPKWVGRRLTT